MSEGTHHHAATSRISICKAGVAELSPSRDRKSTRLNSSHGDISYAVFCLKKKNHNHVAVPSSATLYVKPAPRRFIRAKDALPKGPVDRPAPVSVSNRRHDMADPCSLVAM